jgi:hypothetical protein
MLLREQVSILKIIYLFLDHRKILNIFQFRNYEEKAVLNGLDFNRTTFRNNNEYKISKKITLNQNFSFGLTNSNPKPWMLSPMHTNSHLLYQFVFQQDNMEYLCMLMGLREQPDLSTWESSCAIRFFWKNKKYYTARWFEIRLWNHKVIKILRSITGNIILEVRNENAQRHRQLSCHGSRTG